MVKFCARVNDSDIYRVDFEKEEFEPIGYCSNIDYRYLIPEDGILEITDKDGNKKTIEVKSMMCYLRCTVLLIILKIENI
jgi:hypothetical protein